MGAGTLTDLTRLDGISRRLYGNEGSTTYPPTHLKVVPVSLRPWTRALGFGIATLFCGYLTYLAYRHVFGATGDFYGGEIGMTRLPAWVIILSAVVSFAHDGPFRCFQRGCVCEQKTTDSGVNALTPTLLVIVVGFACSCFCTPVRCDWCAHVTFVCCVQRSRDQIQTRGR